MNRLFYLKLAVQNIRKNAQTYVPYILTCIGAVMMFDILLTLAKNPEVASMNGGSDMRTILNLGCIIIAPFTGAFLFYTNSFLMKRRKMEIGLLNILGMGKKHIARILFFETLCIAAVSLTAGIAGGFLLSKIVYLSMLRLVGETVQWGFYFSGRAAAVTALLYGCVFLLILAVNLARVHVSSPIELLKGGQMGEREPKTRLAVTLIGAASLGYGYYLALTTKNPTMAIGAFFIAVIFVIIGTYCLFTAGSIALLKALKKRKSFYYRTEHFIAVSGLLYRMKQNAAGLAGICILSTSVLVMLSSTASLYVGMDDVIRNRFPRNIMFKAENTSPQDEAQIVQAVQEVLGSAGLQEVGGRAYHDLSLLVMPGERESEFVGMEMYRAQDMDKIMPMYVVPLEDYNRVTGSQAALSAGECMVIAQNKPYRETEFTIYGKTYRAVPADGFELWDGVDSIGSEVYYVIVPDLEELYLLAEQQLEANEFRGKVRYRFEFDLEADEETQMRLFGAMSERMAGIPAAVRGECAAAERGSYFSLNAGLLFLGIFLGTLFVMATALIIYYKQVTEGYDDKRKFEIMQKVGLSADEIRASIRSQILLMFFLPLAAAGLHIVMAFPIITRLLSAMNLTNVRLFGTATAVTFGVFAVVYGAVYGLTSRVYLKIVS